MVRAMHDNKHTSFAYLWTFKAKFPMLPTLRSPNEIHRLVSKCLTHQLALG
jgi:hypothetical protein